MHREGKKRQLLIKNVLFSYKINPLFLQFLEQYFPHTPSPSLLSKKSKPLTDRFCTSILSHTDLVRVDGKGTLKVF